MQESHTPQSAGRQVVVRDERWAIASCDRFDRVSLLHLRGLGDRNRDESQFVLTPFDIVQHAAAATAIDHRSRHSTLAIAARALADAAPWNACWTAADAKIELRPWQLAPAVAAVSGAMRILLADTVGLGKTIQAALIVTELRARSLADRVLVLTPASIREQWATELRERFALESTIFDQAALALQAASLPPDVNPWSTSRLVISSIDLVKRPEVRAALEAVAFDVLIVDEAHHLTPGTDRAAVVSDLAARTGWLVLVTATPHRGDDEAFRFLHQLGDLGTEEMRVFRRSARGVDARLPRRSRTLFVQPTGAERALLDATLEYGRALTRHAGTRGGSLVGPVIARRAASSAAAARRTIARRIALLRGDAAGPGQPVLPWDESDADEVGDAVLRSIGLTDVPAEIAWLERLAELAGAASDHSSKLGVIRRLLRRTGEQVLIFSEYRDVVTLVANALTDLSTVATLHGALNARERRETVNAFVDGRVRTLAATDAASEGLNLQARCRLVVNIELPWMPLRLEQRVGRVDRLGQSRRVHAIHLAHRDSFEGRVIARLERRRSRTGIGVTSVECETSPTFPARARELRRLAWRCAHASSTGAAYASDAHARQHLILVYLVTVRDAANREVHREAVALRVQPRELHRLTRQKLRSIAAHPAVTGALAAEQCRIVDAADPLVHETAGAIERRLARTLAEIARQHERDGWQPSLFDKRAERQSYARQASRDALRRDVERRRMAAEALRHLTATEPRLIAAWAETPCCRA